MNLNQMLHQQSAYETYRIKVERAIKLSDDDPYLHDTITRQIKDADYELQKTLDIIRLDIIRKELKDS